MRRILAPVREENWIKCSVSSVCGLKAVEMASPGTPHTDEMSHKSNLYAQNVTEVGAHIERNRKSRNSNYKFEIMRKGEPLQKNFLKE